MCDEQSTALSARGFLALTAMVLARALLRRFSAAVLGHDCVELVREPPTVIAVCRCGGVTEYVIEMRDIGTRRGEHHEFVRTTCPRERRGRRIIAERLRRYGQVAALPVARLLR